MPNHVINYIESENVTALMQLRDFNNLIPMPIILENIESGSITWQIGELLSQGLSIDEIKAHRPEHCDAEKWLLMTKRCKFARQHFNCLDWYQWRLGHWGTKWNAHDIIPMPNGNAIQFCTAWSHPGPVIEALSKKYPDSVFEIKYADEDIGSNAGQYVIQNGQFIEPDSVICLSKEAYELAFELWGEIEEYRWSEEEQTYVYIDD